MARLGKDKEGKLTITEILFFGKFCKIISRGITITLDELESLSTAARSIAAGATLSLTKVLHGSLRTIRMDAVAGSVITLPAALGSGVRFRILVSALATSNSHILQCVGTDEFQGSMVGIDADTADATIAFAALEADNFDTITFNRTTSGIADIGDWIEVEDVATGVWMVNGSYRATGTIITPFSTS